MAVFSSLRTFRAFQLISRFTKNGGQRGRAYHYQEGLFDERQFPLRPTVFHWRKFKDFLHFYTLLGVIPLTLLATIVNIVKGPAELAEIPEGYEPQHWEYFKNPITRFMAQHIIRDKRIDYEMTISTLSEESERMILRKVEKFVKEYMQHKNDYQSWFYRPVEGYIHRVEREDWKQVRDYYQGQRADVADENMFSDGGNPK